MTAAELKLLRHYADIERSRRCFWDYCNVKAADFYRPSRTYLRVLCGELEDFAEDDTDVMIISLPPRFGKSRTACNFVEWLLGREPTTKIVTGSYNEVLSTQFSKAVRNTIQERKADRHRVVYSDIFPATKIKRGDGAMNLWGLEGNGESNYLATSPKGTTTGFGGDYILIDDLIKNAYEANNAEILEAQWKWFTDTLFSRSEGKRKVIIIMTQWALGDIAHRAKEHFLKIGLNVKELCWGAVNSDGTMLDDEILSREQYEQKRQTMSPHIFAANYDNHAISIADLLYENGFKTYKHSDLPAEYEYICSFADTADEGNDYLCKLTAVKKGGALYVIDAYYTQERMEVTERRCAEIDKQQRVNYTVTESNNGGKGFARNVARIAEEIGNYRTRYSWRATTQNKAAKILTNATSVLNTVIMPEDWRTRWPEFATAVLTYSRAGKNAHDDAPDCLTMLYIEAFEK